MSDELPGEPATPDGAEATWRFPRHARSVGRARARLRQQLAAHGIGGDVADTAELLLSELVTNAVRHAHVPPGREIEAHCEVSGGQLRIEVADASDELPRQRTAGDDCERGRGLLLVDALAAKWGVSPRDGVGKLVWFVLTLPAEPTC